MAVEDKGKVDVCLVILQHVGIQAREEQDVVHQLKQRVGVALDFLHEDGLISLIVLSLEKLGKTDYRIQRRANLVAHIGQERLLQQLGLLRLLGLDGQMALGFHHIRHIAAQTKVADHLALAVPDRHHVEHEPYLAAFLVANLSLDGI